MISAQEVWNSLYTDELESIWKSELGALRKSAMLNYVLARELQKPKESSTDEMKQSGIEMLSKEEQELIDELRELPLSQNYFNRNPTINKRRNISFNREIPKLLDLEKENLDIDIVESSQEANYTFFTFPKVSNDADTVDLTSPIENISVKPFIEEEDVDTTPKSKPISYEPRYFKFPAEVCIKPPVDSDNETLCDVKLETGTTRKKDVKDTFKDYDKFPIPRPRSPLFVHKSEPVRRKADRMQLPGWSCDNCKKFYESTNLSPAELRKKMNACSRHRNKVEPLNETFQGFWDIKMFGTQDEDN